MRLAVRHLEDRDRGALSLWSSPDWPICVTDDAVTVARICIERLMLSDGADVVTAQFDDGHDGGQTPRTVELLGMLGLAKEIVLAEAMCDHDEEEP
jgi:hypothetical protein